MLMNPPFISQSVMQFSFICPFVAQIFPELATSQALIMYIGE